MVPNEAFWQLTLSLGVMLFATNTQEEGRCTEQLFPHKAASAWMRNNLIKVNLHWYCDNEFKYSKLGFPSYKHLDATSVWKVDASSKAVHSFSLWELVGTGPCSYPLWLSVWLWKLSLNWIKHNGLGKKQHWNHLHLRLEIQFSCIPGFFEVVSQNLKVKYDVMLSVH